MRLGDGETIYLSRVHKPGAIINEQGFVCVIGVKVVADNLALCKKRKKSDWTFLEIVGANSIVCTCEVRALFCS